jgi:large subunit ribosomal protein L9
MEVILNERVENLGALGDVVKVKPGYARNYLIPFQKAVRCTKENKQAFERRRAELEKQEQQRINAAQQTKEKLESQTLTIAAKSGESGKLFGSIGPKQIVEALKNQFDLSIEKRYVKLSEETLRNIGEYSVTIQLYANIKATMNVSVIPK